MKRFMELLVVLTVSGCAAFSVTSTNYKTTLAIGSKNRDALAELAIIELQRSALLFSFRNKSKSSAKIIWDDSAMVDAQGNSHRIIHQGVKFSQASQSMPPTLVPRGGKIVDAAMYADGHEFIGTGGWMAPELISCSAPGSICDTASNIGKVISLHLTVEMEGKRREYSAKMKIGEAD